MGVMCIVWPSVMEKDEINLKQMMGGKRRMYLGSARG